MNLATTDREIVHRLHRNECRIASLEYDNALLRAILVGTFAMFVYEIQQEYKSAIFFFASCLPSSTRNETIGPNDSNAARMSLESSDGSSSDTLIVCGAVSKFVGGGAASSAAMLPNTLLNDGIVDDDDDGGLNINDADCFAASTATRRVSSLFESN